MLNSEQVQKIIDETKGKIYFTSDTHVNQQRTMELSKRPFDSVLEMDFYIEQEFDNVLTEDDLLIHLGDVGEFNLNKLKCKTLILLGNYEFGKPEYKGMDNIIHSGVEINLNGRMYRLVHEPNERNKYTLPKVNKNVFYLFGHIHKLQMVKLNGLNVGVDCHNFKPIDVDTVAFYRNAIENFYDDNVFSLKCDS